MLRQLSSNGSCLLSSEILWNELLVFVEFSQLVSLGKVDDGQDSSNGLSNMVDSVVS